MAVRFPIFIGAAVILVMTGCTSGDTGRFIKSEAFEACRHLAGNARARCLDQEQDRAAQRLAEDNRKCLEEIEQQRQRTAIRRGEQAPGVDTAAARGCC